MNTCLQIFAFARRWMIAVVLSCSSLMGAVSVQAETLSSCSFSAGASVGGDLINRGFYITHFSGQSLQSIELRHSANSAGTYLMKMTARSGGFDGEIIGDPTYATVSLGGDAGTNGVQTVYDFGDVPVTPGSTVTFAMEKIEGPGSVYYDVSVPNACPNAVQTNGTTAPLDTTRRDRFGYVLKGRKDTEALHVCDPSPWGADLIHRGIYVQGYAGQTLRYVNLVYQSPDTSARTVRLTVRQGGYDGPIIGTAVTKTFKLDNPDTWQVFSWDLGGSIVVPVGSGRIAFTHEIVSGNSSLYFAINNTLAASTCPNMRTTHGTSGTIDTARGLPAIAVFGDREAPWRSITEFYIPSLQHYFITGRPGEKAILDHYSLNYTRTGRSFKALTAYNAPPGTTPICRFYLPPELGGPNTHFYGVPADCDYLNSLGNPLFQYEGWDFAGVAPVEGQCPEFWSTKVYRSYNNRAAENDSNHRYTTSLSDYNAMTAQGWLPEGVVFCAPTGF